jgi:AcrR family transcriptional regulator
MRYAKDHKEKSRQKLIQNAGRAFRQQGYGMIGVDGLAKAAEMTSGAFYVHFDSKKEAFLEALREGLDVLRDGITQTRQGGGPDWLRDFADFYLGEKRTCDMGDSCTLPTLSSDVERAGEQARTLYENKLREIAGEIVRGLPGTPRERNKQAWADLALLLGGLSLARTVLDPQLSRQIADAVISQFDQRSAKTGAVKEPT